MLASAFLFGWKPTQLRIGARATYSDVHSLLTSRNVIELFPARTLACEPPSSLPVCFGHTASSIAAHGNRYPVVLVHDVRLLRFLAAGVLRLCLAGCGACDGCRNRVSPQSVPSLACLRATPKVALAYSP